MISEILILNVWEFFDLVSKQVYAQCTSLKRPEEPFPAVGRGP